MTKKEDGGSGAPPDLRGGVLVYFFEPVDFRPLYTHNGPYRSSSPNLKEERADFKKQT